jgi:hypothetical protein
MKSFKIFLEDYESQSEFGDFYGDFKDQDKKLHPKFRGRNVIWYAYSKERARKVYPRYVSAREDNIFDPKKLNAVARHVKTSFEPVELFTAIAEARLIDIDYIQLTLKAHHEDRLDSEYSLNEPFTTGDDEVDEFLADEEGWFEENTYVEYEDLLMYAEDREKLDIDYKEGNVDEDSYELMKDSLEQYDYILNEVARAQEDKSGDIGQYWYVLRDGNHRALGAIQGGEPFIYVTLSTNSYNEQ